MSIVLDYALLHGMISKQQHARAAQIEANRRLGARKAKLTRQRKEWAHRLFHNECSKEAYLAEVLAIDRQLSQLK